jgi:hypothetical protein
MDDWQRAVQMQIAFASIEWGFRTLAKLWGLDDDTDNLPIEEILDRLNIYAAGSTYKPQ